MSKIIVLLGQTGSGKTEISIKLAKKLNAQIINSDKVQMYKDVSIGVSKTTYKEMDGIKHYLIDFLDLDQEYSIYDYQNDGRKILNTLIKNNINVIITGGSALYIKALLYNYDLIANNKTLCMYEDLSNEELKRKADIINSNNLIHVNNRKRLVRFLNNYHNTGKAIINENNSTPIYEADLYYLDVPRSILYNRINTRVDNMINSGLIDEAFLLYNKNYRVLDTIIGYKELNKYFKNEISLQEAILLIKQNTRKYAKRQETFFKHQFTNIKYITLDYNDTNKVINDIYLSSL
ncbi:MAG: tRNA (adenosine(37)-N6)-dimethylallyltransferase MiaA [Bacilli bacterium]